jgi:DNA-binding XRE family transcriptional regulator
MLTKICSACPKRKAKPLSAFAIVKRSRRHEAEGRSEVCKDCTWRRELERRAKTITDRVNIPELLVNLRRRENWTQQEAAIQLGIPVGTYIGYEQGRRGKRMSEKLYKHILEFTSAKGLGSVTHASEPADERKATDRPSRKTAHRRRSAR